MTGSTGLLSSDELARAMDVSRAMVHKYVQRGMPVAATQGRSRRFDLETCRAWHKACVRGVSEATGKGGKRGGGRRRTKAQSFKAQRSQEEGEGGDGGDGGEDATRSVALPGEGGGGEWTGDAEAALLRLLERKEAAGEQLTFADLAKLPGGTIAAFERAENVLRKRNERLKEEGLLVDAREAEAAFGERLRDASRRLVRLPRRLARLVAEEIDLEASLHGAVEGVIRSEVEEVMRGLGAGEIHHRGAKGTDGGAG